MKFLILINFLLSIKIILCGAEVTPAPKDIGKCGGTFSGYQYLVTSPNYPENYPSGQDCVYELKGNPSAKCEQEFHLQFLDFQLEVSDGCAKDYVRIGTGSVYCGKSVGIRKFNGLNNSLKIIFHSDNETSARGFKILVTALSCAASQLDPKENVTTASDSNVENDFKGGKEKLRDNVRISYPNYRPEIEFEVEEGPEAGRGDQPPSRIQTPASSKKVFNFPSGIKTPQDVLELPEFAQHDFHDKNCGHSYASNTDEKVASVPKITSYLYLPPAAIVTPPKTAIANSSLKIISNEATIKNFQDRINFPTPPASELILPTRQSPPPFKKQILQQIETSFQLPKVAQASSKFYDTSNRWLTYGPPENFPTNTFDPFLKNNNNNDYPEERRPPCGGGGKENWNPSIPPNIYPVTSRPARVNPSVTNFGNGNGFPDSNDNFDPSFVVSTGNEGKNYFPNNRFYGTDIDTTYYNVGVSECCGSTYSSDSFLLSSPGFPSLIHSSSSYACRYTIQRTSQNICQLSLYFKFFNFGSDDQFCAYGYVEIDGRRLCGCKTGLNITTPFDIATKTINVKYAGYPRGKFNGFVLQVTQESCATSYLTSGTRFPYIENPWSRNLKRRSADEEERKKRDLGYVYARPNAAALTSQNLLINSCQVFKFLNWVKAAKQVYLRSAQCSSTTASSGVSSSISVIPIFPETGYSAIINFPSNSNCEIVNVVDGTISSPSYPNNYSNNLNQCYRFFKAPGYCQLEIAVLDFDLENSTLCTKDYVSFSGQKRRYCGTSLAGTRTIIDMSRSTFADLYFVTDSSGTGRGFRAGFTQILC